MFQFNLNFLFKYKSNLTKVTPYTQNNCFDWDVISLQETAVPFGVNTHLHVSLKSKILLQTFTNISINNF